MSRAVSLRAVLHFVLLLLASEMSLSFAAAATRDVPQIPLQSWKLESSQKVTSAGAEISMPQYDSQSWREVKVPTTVVAAQVAKGELKEPYFGMNLRDYPGMTYPIGRKFTILPMDASSPYAVPWWYRTEFTLPASYHGRHTWLHFKGINYRANIWLNGRMLADSKDVAGAYRTFEFDVTSFVTPGKPNVLAVQVFAPTEKDLGINWVDWNPAPPDKNMGLWGEVYLATSGPVSVRYPTVTTHLVDASLKQADLTITAQLQNATDQPVTGKLEADLLGIHLTQQVSLEPNEIRSVYFTPEQFSKLRISQPQLWWPAEIGTPALHEMQVLFSTEGHPSDEQRTQFGIREVTSELTKEGYRLFKVNGRPILIRGGAWAHDMLLRTPSPERLEAEFEYVRDMHLNTIRLEGQIGSDRLFQLADEKGIFVMAGWCCCDIWERWNKWNDETLRVATESLRTEALRMRAHPSLLVWLNGSDGPPPAKVESAYLNVLKSVSWPNPILSSAADVPTDVSGRPGVKMTGPYEYEPPSYWFASKAPAKAEDLSDTRYGGGFGYNTETSPGPAIPPLQSLKKMLPSDSLWPVNNVWNYHAAGERFKTLGPFNKAMDATYGKPASLDEYLLKAQAMAYDSERAMFEAYGKNKYTATGVIQWMLNNAWPSTYWHLYDYFLYPAGSYFGAKKANEPLHVQYSYDDQSVVVVNHRWERFPGLQVRADVYDLKLNKVSSQQATVDVEPDASVRVLTIPSFPADNSSAVYFIKLSLQAADGREISSNFYWRPAVLSTIDWKKASEDTSQAPIATFEDLTALNSLPKVRVQAEIVHADSEGKSAQVRLHNPSKDLAFQVHLGIRQHGSEDEILPVLWEDNYISLLPGETRVVSARYLAANALGEAASLVVDGWNVEPVTVEIKAERKSATRTGMEGGAQ